MSVDGSDGFRWMRRTNTGGNTTTSNSGSGTPPNVWVRVVRSGGNFLGYKSTDGVNWTLVSSVKLGSLGITVVKPTKLLPYLWPTTRYWQPPRQFPKILKLSMVTN